MRDLFKRWGPVIARFTWIQILVQGLGFITGLYLLRILSVREYAFYTLANSFQGTLAVLADTGITGSMLIIGGRIWEDRWRLGRLIQEGIRIRWWLGLGGAAVMLPLLAILLTRSGATLWQTRLLCGLVALGAAAQLSVGVLVMVPRLYSQFGRLQRLDGGGALIRLISVVVVGGAAMSAVIASAISVAVTLLQERFAFRWAADTVDLRQTIRSEDRSEIWKIVKTNAPNAIYFCLQGQLAVLLISWFGVTSQIAEVGALSRLGAVFGLIGSIMAGIICPAFARCRSTRRVLQHYLMVMGAFMTLGVFFLTVAWWEPKAFLMVLGPHYLHLERELVWMVATTVSGSVVGAMWSLNSSRGWIQGLWIEIPISIVLQVLGAIVLNLGTVRGVLMLSVLANSSAGGFNLWLAWKGLREEINREARAVRES